MGFFILISSSISNNYLDFISLCLQKHSQATKHVCNDNNNNYNEEAVLRL